ncbi:hypothetical protein CEXT_649211 [Caerostris extrusa]|uniref:Uncharacterized protein n=1 Tax=Caerostris extrusa TaxID=172846 RepID=A0AAV4NVP6_CAEEX|nr:hypothetical protein CEXT_649211 [Caerostris extrusa]
MQRNQNTVTATLNSHTPNSSTAVFTIVMTRTRHNIARNPKQLFKQICEAAIYKFNLFNQNCCKRRQTPREVESSTPVLFR